MPETGPSRWRAPVLHGAPGARDTAPAFLIYFGYYYAGSGGTVQVLTDTGESLFEEYKTDFEELLNGFVAPGS